MEGGLAASANTRHVQLHVCGTTAKRDLLTHEVDNQPDGVPCSSERSQRCVIPEETLLHTLSCINRDICCWAPRWPRCCWPVCTSFPGQQQRAIKP